MAYTVTGPDDGTPVVYCHGAIGTPLSRSVDLEQLTDRLGVRYIAPSRPGVGGSDALEGRSVRDFARDVGELVDALGISRFAVVGVSAGGPYALAVAREFGDRVLATAVCSSLSPRYELHRTPGMGLSARIGLAIMRRFPALCRGTGDAVLPVIARHPWLLRAVIAAHAAPSDRRRLAGAEQRGAVSTSFLDAASGGVGGLIEDFLTYSAGWGFQPGEVSGEVHLWHGARDPLVPVRHALELAGMLPNCRVFIDPDEGHHFFRENLEQILGVLTEERPGVVVPMPLRLQRAA